MLALPESGMATSINTHNVSLAAVCDWIEASILFQADVVSKSDAVDALLENEVYEKQDFASEIIEQAWNVLAERVDYLKSPLGLIVTRSRISRMREWQEFPAYAFCMVLACAEHYPTWAKGWSTNASVQGDYFEALAAEAMALTFPGWKVKRVGWSPDNPAKLTTTIHDLINDLDEVEGAELDVHVRSSANELGLDLLAYYSYGDQRSSSVVMLMQCAAGKNWVSKRHTPSLEIWRKVINFNAQPLRGFIMPFAFAEQREFRRQTAAVGGIFIDRNRLLGAFPRNAGTVSTDLSAKLRDWSNVEIAKLPTDRT